MLKPIQVTMVSPPRTSFAVAVHMGAAVSGESLGSKSSQSAASGPAPGSGTRGMGIAMSVGSTGSTMGMQPAQNRIANEIRRIAPIVSFHGADGGAGGADVGPGYGA